MTLRNVSLVLLGVVLGLLLAFAISFSPISHHLRHDPPTGVCGERR